MESTGTNSGSAGGLAFAAASAASSVPMGSGRGPGPGGGGGCPGSSRGGGGGGMPGMAWYLCSPLAPLVTAGWNQRELMDPIGIKEKYTQKMNIKARNIFEQSKNQQRRAFKLTFCLWNQREMIDSI